MSDMDYGTGLALEREFQRAMQQIRNTPRQPQQQLRDVNEQGVAADLAEKEMPSVIADFLAFEQAKQVDPFASNNPNFVRKPYWER